MRWQVEFYPPRGERNSPLDYIINLNNISDQGHIRHRLETLEELDIAEWPKSWVKQIDDKIFQLTAGRSRLMYCLDRPKIVVLHAFMKASQKTKKKDINTARRHYDRYIEQKGK